MAREFTESEAQQIYEAEKGLRESGLDVDHEHAQDNANSILQYLQQNPQVPITVASIYAFVEKNKNQLIWRTPAQREFDKVAAEDPAKAHQLSYWLANQKSLINTGDQGFQNASNLLAELAGREINSQTIHEAIGRIEAPTSKFATRKRPPLHYVLRPARPLSEAAKADDPNRKPGQFISEHINEPEWARRSRERSEREAREAASQQSDASVRARVAAGAKSRAEQLRGATGSEDHQLQSLFVITPGTSEIDWPATEQARLRMQQQFTKAREVRRFIR